MSGGVVRRSATSTALTLDLTLYRASGGAPWPSLGDAYTALEDAPEGMLRSEGLRRALSTLAEEKDRAFEEAHRYSKDIGIRPE